MENSHEKIKKFIDIGNGNILIHCFMGASRSASIVANFLAREFDKDITDVITELTEKRPIINLTERLTRDLLGEFNKNKQTYNNFY